MTPQAGTDPLGRRILSSLYLKGAVSRARLETLCATPGRAGSLDAALLRLGEEGMVVQRHGRVALTRLGGKVAYALACRDPHPLRTLLQELGERPPDGGRLLDLGCGAATYLLEAAGAAGLEAIGMDRDAESLSLAAGSLSRAGRRAALVRAEAERLPFLSGSFDRVICVVVLPYVREREALAEAARVLRGGGRMIITAHGPGYYLGLAAGGGMTLKRRLFGAVSLIGTFTARAGLRLPGARFQTPQAIARALAAGQVRVVRALRRGRRFGLTESLRIVAEKRAPAGEAS